MWPLGVTVSSLNIIHWTSNWPPLVSSSFFKIKNLKCLQCESLDISCSSTQRCRSLLSVRIVSPSGQPVLSYSATISKWYSAWTPQCSMLQGGVFCSVLSTLDTRGEGKTESFGCWGYLMEVNSWYYGCRLRILSQFIKRQGYCEKKWTKKFCCLFSFWESWWWPKKYYSSFSLKRPFQFGILKGLTFSMTLWCCLSGQTITSESFIFSLCVHKTWSLLAHMCLCVLYTAVKLDSRQIRVTEMFSQCLFGMSHDNKLCLHWKNK